MKPQMTLPQLRAQSEKQRNLLLAIAAGLAFSVAGLTVYTVHSHITNTVPVVQKMTFDEFVEKCLVHPSLEDQRQLQAFYDRAKEEFAPLQANMSSEMYNQFTASYTRLLMVQLKVYEKQLNVEDFSQNAYRLLGPRVRFLSLHHPARPPMKPRHIWIPDSFDDVQWPGTYIAFWEKRG